MLEHAGRQYSSPDAWRTAKRTQSAPKAAPAAHDDEMPGEGDMDEQDGAAIAAEHGPATDVMIHHEHEMGGHHVTSEHADGHHHESDHESAEAAHEHAKKLAGVGAEGGEEHSGGADEGDDW